jgi:hypothetical protein
MAEETATPRSKPKVRTAFLKSLDPPYAASTSKMSPGILSSRARVMRSRASSGFVLNTRSSGTRAFSRRATSSVHDLGM